MIDLIHRKISISKAKKEQDGMIFKINELKNFILLEQKRIANKNALKILRNQRQECKKNIILTTQKSVKKCNEAV